MRVLVVDDHPVIHEMMRYVVPRVLPTSTLLCAGSLEDGLVCLRNSEFIGLVVLDLGLPGCMGIEALTRMLPDANDVPIVVYSGNESSELVRLALYAGARAFVSKSAELPELRKVIRAAAECAAKRPSSTCVSSDRNESDEPQLTSRQLQVLFQLRTGSSNRAIARALAISEDTVKQHLHAIFRTLGVSNRTEALAESLRLGIAGDAMQVH